MKKYIVELLGTFALVLVVGLSLTGTFAISTPVLAGLVVMIFVYAVGHISGGHFNPAITVGAWSIGKIKMQDAMLYIISQCLGAGLALLVVSSTVGMAPLSVDANWTVALAEFLGMLMFAFGVASVMYEKAPRDFSGIVAGGSLLLGITIAALMGSNGVLNPAVAFGIGSFNVFYAFAPIVGSIIGMQGYKYLIAE